MIKPSVQRGLAVTAVTAVTLVAGCQTPPVENQESWSTKSDSVIVPGEVRLHAPVVAALPANALELRDAARSLLLEAVESSSPLLRANALEALQATPEGLEPIVRAALGDENRGVRFTAAMTVGTLRLDELADLCAPLLHDASESVQAAAIYALRRCGRAVDPTPLAQMLWRDDPEVKGNAALVLGELGDPSARPLLRAAAQRPMPRTSVSRSRVVELQIAESMVKLGDDEELQVIRAALFNPTAEHGEIKALACLACGRLGDSVYAATLLDLALREGPRREAAEVRMAATHALARIEPRAAPMEVPLGFVRSDRPELRAQAALTLGESDNPAHLPILSQMMSDESAMVQVAAAGAVLRMTEG